MEAVVCYLMAVMGGEQKIKLVLLARETDPQHTFPFKSGPFKMKPWPKGEHQGFKL